MLMSARFMGPDESSKRLVQVIQMLISISEKIGDFWISLRGDVRLWKLPFAAAIGDRTMSWLARTHR